MNAAFLLMTTAWFAGADAAPPKPTEKMPAPAPAAVVAGGACCGDCGSDCGCENRFKAFFEKIRARFHRSCDSCCETPCAKPAPACCAPAPKACDSCDSCESFGDKLRARLHGLFRRHNDCDTCDSCCGSAAPAPLPKVETMPNPKKTSDPGQKMPVGIEPPLKPAGLEKAPTVVPNVTIESEKSPY